MNSTTRSVLLQPAYDRMLQVIRTSATRHVQRHACRHCLCRCPWPRHLLPDAHASCDLNLGLALHRSACQLTSFRPGDRNPLCNIQDGPGVFRIGACAMTACVWFRQWVPFKPGSTYSGYSRNQLSAPSLPWIYVQNQTPAVSGCVLCKSSDSYVMEKTPGWQRTLLVCVQCALRVSCMHQFDSVCHRYMITKSRHPLEQRLTAASLSRSVMPPAAVLPSCCDQLLALEAPEATAAQLENPGPPCTAPFLWPTFPQ